MAGGVEVMTEGGVEVQLEREARQGRERESERTCSDLYRLRGAGGHPKALCPPPETGALIGPDPLRGLAAMARNCNIPFPAR